MKRVRILKAATGDMLAGRVGVADSWWRRFRGLLGQPEPGPGEGLMLVPCRAIHMSGMRYPIDVAFLDAEGAVVAAYKGLRPGRRTAYHRVAWAALELKAGSLETAGVDVGDRLSWEGLQ